MVGAFLSVLYVLRDSLGSQICVCHTVGCKGIRLEEHSSRIICAIFCDDGSELHSRGVRNAFAQCHLVLMRPNSSLPSKPNRQPSCSPIGSRESGIQKGICFLTPVCFATAHEHTCIPGPHRNAGKKNRTLSKYADQYESDAAEHYELYQPTSARYVQCSAWHGSVLPATACSTPFVTSTLPLDPKAACLSAWKKKGHVLAIYGLGARHPEPCSCSFSCSCTDPCTSCSCTDPCSCSCTDPCSCSCTDPRSGSCTARMVWCGCRLVH